MSTTIPQAGGWKQSLPTLEGLINGSNDTGEQSIRIRLHSPPVTRSDLVLLHVVSAILRPFSRLGIPFFRRSTSTSTDADPLRRLRELTAEDHAPAELDLGGVHGALAGVQILAKRVKAQVTMTAGELEELCEGYLRGLHLVSQVSGQSLSEKDTEGIREVAKQCLVGLGLLSTRLSEPITLHRSIIASLFPHSPGDQTRFLTPIFQRPKALTDKLQYHHVQRSDTKSASSAPAVEPVRELEAEAVYQLHLLDGYIEMVAKFETLPAAADDQHKTTKAGIKARDEAERARPLRITLEARLAKCELATALASADIALIKRRAIALHKEESEEAASVASTRSEKDGKEEEEDGNDDHESDEEAAERIEQKPVITEPEAATPEHSHTTADTREAERWDDRAQTALLDCLEYAASLIRERHSKVLIEIVDRSDWLDETDAEISGERSKKHAEDSETNSEDESSDDDSDTDSDSQDDQQASGPHCPAPLRAIFRLQDRYEELRLAVWLALPVDFRGKMSAFMRGVPTSAELAAMREGGMGEAEVLARSRGRIGEAWDHLGLLLLKHYDRYVSLP